ncbi:hypothetical protein ACFW6S_04345 [Streptomyces sp. NPDC058740]|uniref:hypothetical protein n=1 Tax=Streptomyces sp. NPDC058740 TaxID=3346619 RepID=UPI0036830932
MDVLKYFEENPEIFAALVGAIIGSLGGGWIQARGGRDQAAAREAAKIQAEAQRVAALWTVRQVQIAEFIRAVNGQVQRCDRLWFELDSDSDALSDEIAREADELDLRWAEVRVLLTENAVTAAGHLVLAVNDLVAHIQRYSWVRHARILVGSATAGDQALAAAVARILTSEADYASRARDLRAAVSNLTESQAEHLAVFNERSDHDLEIQRGEARAKVFRCLNDLVDEAREMLGSQNDVAPTVPQQRRWWGRAAA